MERNYLKKMSEIECVICGMPDVRLVKLTIIDYSMRITDEEETFLCKKHRNELLDKYFKKK